MKNYHNIHFIYSAFLITLSFGLDAAEKNSTAPSKIPLIFSYGFGDNREHFYKKFGEPLLTPAINETVKPWLFDYQDASVKPREAGWFSFWNVPLSRFWNTNFGQAPSTLELLRQLICVANTGHNAAAFITHSCGSASATGLIDRLAQPEKYKAEWYQLGFVTAAGDLDLGRINELNQIVKRGFLVFVHPLLDIEQSFKTIAQKKLWFLPQFISSNLGKVALYVSSLFNNYRLGAQKPIEQLKELNQKKLLDDYRSLVLLTKPDSVVGNGHDEELKQLQGPTFTVIQETTSTKRNGHFSLSAVEQQTAQSYLTKELEKTTALLEKLPTTPVQQTMPFPQQNSLGFWGTVSERPGKIALLTLGAVTGSAAGTYLFYKFALPKIKQIYSRITQKIGALL